MEKQLPKAVNFHILSACNYSCGFCFAKFKDSEQFMGCGQLAIDDQKEIIRQLAANGAEKITFAGGEPTLSKNIEQLMATAKQLGLVTMLVTNGSRLHTFEDSFYDHLDWLVLSIDSANDDTNVRSGRAQGSTTMGPDGYVREANRARARGVRIKVNTVVHRHNAKEDLSDLIAEIRPERWKLFQVLPVEDQNGTEIDEFRIDDDEFDRFVERHAQLEERGTNVVPESNDEMRGTYAMIDPAGRFYDSSSGYHVYSRPILDVGVLEAFAEVTFDEDRFEERGGIYDWSSTGAARFVALAGESGVGKDTAADILREFGWKRIAIADAIKRITGRLFDLNKEQLWGPARNVEDPRWACTPRELYQSVGDALREEDSQIWIRLFRDEIEARLDAGERLVWSDLRTNDELQLAHELGATTILLRRSAAGAPGISGNHETEKAARALPEQEFGNVLLNDGTLDQLQANLLQTVGVSR